jgi:hypothetical protein
MKIKIPAWTSHYNQILYSLLIFTENNNIKLEIIHDKTIPLNGCVLQFDNFDFFLDYSDNSDFLSNTQSFDYYLKRSLKIEDKTENILPLNFQVNFSYKPLNLIKKMPFSILKDAKSRIEIIRALDFSSILSNDSHYAKTIDKILTDDTKKTVNSSPKIIFMTRLWDPARNGDPMEKKRRNAQNNFRINACRIIKKEFPNSTVGLYPDYYAKNVAKDILLDISNTSKRKYLNLLKNSEIAIADDGLKDTPGWKIGEYIMTSKAIITTPINTLVENFKENINYLSTMDRENFEIIPDLINSLLDNNKYIQMQKDNRMWYENHLDPNNYIGKILTNCNLQIEASQSLVKSTQSACSIKSFI